MTNEFSSIWLEMTGKANEKVQLIAGFYREWNLLGEKSEESQVLRMEIFSNQIEAASKNCNTNIVIFGAPRMVEQS